MLLYGFLALASFPDVQQVPWHYVTWTWTFHGTSLGENNWRETTYRGLPGLFSLVIITIAIGEQYSFFSYSDVFLFVNIRSLRFWTRLVVTLHLSWNLERPHMLPNTCNNASHLCDHASSSVSNTECVLWVGLCEKTVTNERREQVTRWEHYTTLKWL